MPLEMKSQQAVEHVEQFQRYLAARPLPSAKCYGDPHHTSDQFPIGIGRFGERLMRPDRGIVDQDVDPTELGQRLGGKRLDLCLFADVG
jgi:hypothetical protein